LKNFTIQIIYIIFFNTISARKCGFQGEKIVLASDGFEVLDDEDLMENLGQQLMILGKSQNWCPELNVASTDSKPSGSITLIQMGDDFITESTSTAQSETDFATNLFIETATTAESTSATTSETANNNYDAEKDVSMEEILAFDEEEPQILSADAEKFSKFELPWNKLPTDLIADILGKRPLKNNDLKAVSLVFIAELQVINPRVPLSVMKRVAYQAAELYPDSFLQRDEMGQFISKKPVLFLSKMIARRNYKNRAPAPSKHTIQKVSKEAAKIREANKLAETVQNYQPNIIGKEKELSEKKNWLKQVYGSHEEIVLKQEISKAMMDTYGLQRFEINQAENAGEIFNDWPFLKKMAYFKSHFETLTGGNLDNFKHYFNKYKGALITHLESANKAQIKKILPSIREQHVDIKAIKLLTSYFKEEYTTFVVDFPVSLFIIITQNIIFLFFKALK
jgi:hypothetical protein